MNQQFELFNRKSTHEEEGEYSVNTSGVWTLEHVRNKLNEINNKGFISIPSEDFRRDEGVIGQLLEREFNVSENNLSIRDLGTYELKGMRIKSKTLTLCHKTTIEGLTPIQVFDRFGYIKPSNRDKSVMKKKLFTTVNGINPNHLDLILTPVNQTTFSMYYQPNRNIKEFICKWDIGDSIGKIDSVILALAETKGTTNSKKEEFHFIEGWLYRDIKEFDILIKQGIVVVDFCIDQVVGSNKAPHDRGPHIRIPKSKLKIAYNHVQQIM